MWISCNYDLKSPTVPGFDFFSIYYPIVFDFMHQCWGLKPCSQDLVNHSFIKLTFRLIFLIKYVFCRTCLTEIVYWNLTGRANNISSGPFLGPSFKKLMRKEGQLLLRTEFQPRVRALCIGPFLLDNLSQNSEKTEI